MVDGMINEYFKLGVLGLGWVMAIWLIVREGFRQERVLKVIENNTASMTLLSERVNSIKEE